jgi:hypothetical protein
MNSKKFAPGIYGYESVGLLSTFNSLIEYFNSQNNFVFKESGELEEDKIETVNISPEDLDDNYELTVLYNKFDQKFSEIEKLYFQNFNTKNFKVNFTKREFIFCVKYTQGRSAPYHFDDMEELVRRVSVLYYPNDNYLGGELVFPEFNVKIKPKADQMIIFPSSYIYYHYVIPVENGTRYSIGSMLH